MDKVYIIAEAGVNHNGSLDKALELVDVAADAGADAVKFQTFHAEQLVSSRSPKPDYQLENTDKSESQLNMLQELELGREDHQLIVDRCSEKNIEFLSTPYDVDSLHFLVDEFGVPYIKIASADITNAYLLWQSAQTDTFVILSTGMSTIAEIENALGVLSHGYIADEKPASLVECQKAYASPEGYQVLEENVQLLHCTTEYPAPPHTVHLRAMDTLEDVFNLPVGYSDHTEGIEVPIGAVARGATVIEKHYTLDRTLPGPDHQASLEPDELHSMISSIRRMENAVGSARKYPRGVEWENRQSMRRSLVASQAISRGETIDEEDLEIKRPGQGLSPMHFWEQCGRQANQDYEPGDLIRQ